MSIRGMIPVMIFTDPTDDSSLELPPTASGGNLADQPIAPKATKPPRRPLPRVALIAVAITSGLALIGLGAFALTRPAPKPAATQVTINTQSLDAGTLTKLSKQADGAGKTKQQLSVTPDTVFQNGVTAEGAVTNNKSLKVIGTLDVGDTSNLQGSVTVGGNLAVRGTLSVAGAISAASLNIGALTITNLTASGSLNFANHLVPTGGAPSITSSVAATGSTVSVTGNDTAGTITISTGAVANVPGELAIIRFKNPFSATPKVQITPITADGASLRYYATRSTSFFTINTSTAPATNTSYTFDYLITQ